MSIEVKGPRRGCTRKVWCGVNGIFCQDCNLEYLTERKKKDNEQARRIIKVNNLMMSKADKEIKKLGGLM